MSVAPNGREGIFTALVGIVGVGCRRAAPVPAAAAALGVPAGRARAGLACSQKFALSWATQAAAACAMAPLQASAPLFAAMLPTGGLPLALFML